MSSPMWKGWEASFATTQSKYVQWYFREIIPSMKTIEAVDVVTPQSLYLRKHSVEEYID